MEMWGPTKCPRCGDGKVAGGKPCVACRGSGQVYLVPAPRPVDPAAEEAMRELLMNWQSGQVYG